MLSFLQKGAGKTIRMNDIDPLVGKVELIDIREPYEYQAGTLKTAKNVPMNELMANPDKYMKKDKTYYLFCLSGSRSQFACRKLSIAGFDVINMLGGMAVYCGIHKVK